MRIVEKMNNKNSYDNFQIIQIWNGKALAVNLNFANISDDVIGVELSVQRATRIEVMDQFRMEEIQSYTKVSLQNSTTDSNQLIGKN